MLLLHGRVIRAGCQPFLVIRSNVVERFLTFCAINGPSSSWRFLARTAQLVLILRLISSSTAGINAVGSLDSNAQGTKVLQQRGAAHAAYDGAYNATQCKCKVKLVLRNDVLMSMSCLGKRTVLLCSHRGVRHQQSITLLPNVYHPRVQMPARLLSDCDVLLA